MLYYSIKSHIFYQHLIISQTATVASNGIHIPPVLHTKTKKQLMALSIYFLSLIFVYCTYERTSHNFRVISKIISQFQRSSYEGCHFGFQEASGRRGQDASRYGWSDVFGTARGDTCPDDKKRQNTHYLLHWRKFRRVCFQIGRSYKIQRLF